MDKKKLIEKLSKEFPVIVRTEFHIQIELPPAGERGQHLCYHNIWFTSNGSCKARLFGDVETYDVGDYFDLTPKKLLARLRSYDYTKTDLSAMQELTSFIAKVEDKQGIFVDAGYKKGSAKICVVRSQKNGDMDIAVRKVEAISNIDAEKQAILLASRLYPTDEPIYTDCKTLESLARVIWIPREQNKQADSLGNMRKK